MRNIIATVDIHLDPNIEDLFDKESLEMQRINATLCIPIFH